RVWVLSVCPDVYGAIVERWVAAEPRITVLVNTRLSGVVTTADRLTGVEAVGPGGPIRLRTSAVVDATGCAEVVRLIDPSLLHDDRCRAAGGLIVRLRGVTPGTLACPGGLRVVQALRGAAEDGTLPPACGKAWVDAGVYEDEVYVKLFVPLPDDWRERRDEITREALGTRDAVVSF